MTADWETMEHATMGFDSSSDLFGGVLFGDELMDLYNPETHARSGTDCTPTLPSFTPTKAEEGNSAVQNDTSDKSADNLGAFQPTTSCSELDTLMPKTDATKTKKAPHKKASDEKEPTKSKSNPKKRGSPVQPNAPSKKAATETNQLPHKPEQKRGPVAPHVPAPAPTSVVAPPPQVNKSAVPHSTNSQAPPPNMRVNPNIVPPVQYVMPQHNPNPHAIHAQPAPASAPSVARHHVAPVIAHLPQIKNTGPHANIIPTGPPKINTSVVPVAPTHNGVNTVSPHPPPPHPKNHSTSRNQKQQPEAQFKDVAQAAVSNLILNVATKQQKQNNTTGMNANQQKKAVNTSSAHIAALTSSNWVAACSAGVDDDAEPGSAEAEQAAALAAANDPAAAKAARARRANLSPDERARQNRDRNREHARNTRLRKKAYVEELKKTLTELVAQRDTAELEKRHETQRDLEVREVRFRVMEEFLKLRACGGDAGLLARWVAILDDGFTLMLPKTPYRQMAVSNTPHLTKLHRTVSSENTTGMTVAALNNPNEQVMKGATESMADAAKVSTFISSLGSRPHSNPVTMSYLCDRKHFMMDGTSACLDWVLTTSGLLNQGHSAEIYLKGTMRAKFCPASNKLLSAELQFDTGSVLAQTRRATFMPQNPVTQYVPTPSPLPLQPAPPVVKDVMPTEQQQQQQQQQAQQQLTSYNYSSTISISSTERDESSTEGN